MTNDVNHRLLGVSEKTPLLETVRKTENRPYSVGCRADTMGLEALSGRLELPETASTESSNYFPLTPLGNSVYEQAPLRTRDTLLETAMHPITLP